MTARESLHRFLILACDYLFYSLVLLLPLFFDRRLGIVFSLSKVTILRMVVPILLLGWAIRWWVYQEEVPPRPKLFWWVASFILIVTAATLTSVHPVVSFLGFYGRFEGLWTWWLYGCLFFLAYLTVRTVDQFQRLAILVTVAGGAMGIYGIIQRFGLDPYKWGGVNTVQFIIATIGQPNFAAAYVDMAFMFGLYLFIKRPGKKEETVVGNWKFLVLGALYAIYICILYATSRGGTVGFLVGAVLFLTLLGRRLIFENWKRLAVLFGGIILITGFTLRQPEYSVVHKSLSQIKVQEKSTIGKTKLEYEGASGSRIETWKSAVQIISHFPLLGIGPEVLKMVFPRFETDKFRFYEGFHVKQDRCHNEVFDLAVTKGVPALLLYAGLLATFFFIVWRRFRTAPDPDTKLIMITLMTAAAAYIAQNQFSFGVVAITSLFWIILGTGCAMVEETQSMPGRPPEREIQWLPLAGVATLTLVIAFISFVPYQADLHFKEGKTMFEMREYQIAEPELFRAVSQSPWEGQFVTHLGLTRLNLWAVGAGENYYRQAAEALAYGQQIDPYNADNFYMASRLVLMKGKSTTNMALAERLSKAAVAIDPYYGEAFINLGFIMASRGQKEAAATNYLRALEINPNLEDGMRGIRALGGLK